MKEFPECNYTSKDDSGGPFCGLDPSILSLERVDETFAGNYTCQGKNVAEWGPISDPVELVVYCKFFLFRYFNIYYSFYSTIKH